MKQTAGQVSRTGQDDAQMQSKNSKKQKKSKRRRDTNNKRRTRWDGEIVHRGSKNEEEGRRGRSKQREGEMLTRSTNHEFGGGVQ